MRALICNVPTDARLLRCGPDDEKVAGQGLASNRSTGSRMSHAAAAAGQGPSPYPRVDEYLHIMASQVNIYKYANQLFCSCLSELRSSEILACLMYLASFFPVLSMINGLAIREGTLQFCKSFVRPQYDQGATYINPGPLTLLQLSDYKMTQVRQIATQLCWSTFGSLDSCLNDNSSPLNVHQISCSICMLVRLANAEAARGAGWGPGVDTLLG